MAETALSGLKVLEVGEFVSAPWCGKLLASMGAEVIKVEPPGGGDRARRAGPFPGDIPHLEKSGLFLYLNTDKLGVTLDLQRPTGRSLALELVRQVDVVVDNHRPGELAAWGLDHARLREANPRVVVTSITPFGWEGPWSSWRSSDLVAFHTGGVGYETPVNYVTDPEAQPPLKGGEYQADMAAGWTAASATLIAVRHQRRFGQGQLVDVSTQEAVANLIRPNITMWTYAGDPQQGRLKNGLRRVLPCRDGYVSLIATNDNQWEGLVRMMGDPEWARSELFADREGRFEHADAIDPMLEQFTLNYSKAELFTMGQQYHVPCFPVNNASELLNAEQYEHRGFWAKVEHPLAGGLRFPGAPYRFSATPPATRRAAPSLGQHNEEVFCRRLGYRPEGLRDLAQAGVV